MKPNIQNFLSNLRSSSPGRKFRWLVMSSTGAFVLILFLWFGLIQAEKTITQAKEKQLANPSPPIFNVENGLASVKSSFSEIYNELKSVAQSEYVIEAIPENINFEFSDLSSFPPVSPTSFPDA